MKIIKIGLKNKTAKNLFNVFESNLKKSDKTIVDLLSKFKKEDYLQYPILFDLIIHKKTKILENLFKMGVLFTYQDAAGANALHVACGISGDLEIVKLLTRNKILNDINAKTDEGETPFLLAIMYNHSDIVRYFLQNFEPDLSMRTIFGETAFSIAQKNNNLEMLILLEAAKSGKNIDEFR